MEPNSRLNPFNSSVLLHLISEKIPLFVLVIISSILTMIAQKSTHAVVPMEIITFKERVSNAILSYSNYLIKTMLPFNLSIYYPHLNNSFHNWKLVSCFILLLLITYMGLRFFYRYPYLLVGLLWFFGTLVPVIGLVQVGNQAMADRYTYIPLIGLFIAFVWSASDFFNKYVKNKKVIYPLILSVLIALTYLSHKQVGYWKSSISLYKHAVEATENNWFAHNLLGGAFYDNDEINESIFHFKESIKISPSFSSSHSNLAMALSRKRDFKEALSHYEIAIKLEPNDPIIFFNMGTTLSLMGKTDEAAKAFEKALAIDPDSADSQLRLAQIRHFQGNYDKAKYHYKKAITINPKLVDAHYKYGLLLIRLGDFKE